MRIPEIQLQPPSSLVKPLWELSNNADIADLKLFLETQLGLDLRSPLHVKNDEKILLLLKPYGLEKELRSVGRLYKGLK